MSGALQGMITSLKNNKRVRKTRFDKKHSLSNHAYNEFVDHTEMTTHEFAAFQKKLFKEKAQYKRKIRIIFGIIMTIILSYIVYFLYFMKIY